MPRIQVLNSIFLKCLIYLFLLVICTTYSFLFEYVCSYALLFRRVLLVELLNQKNPHLVELIVFFLGRGDWFSCAAISKL